MLDPERVASSDDAAFYAQIRSRIEHEDGLIASRLLWLTAVESFLSTPYASVLNGLSAPEPHPDPVHHVRMMTLIPLLGIAASALIFSGIIGAVQAIVWLRGRFRARIPDEGALRLPPIHAPGPIVAAGLAAPLILPPVFIVVWAYLLFIQGAP